MKKALVILGPTATGKTDLALELAKRLEGELVACDSRQVYTGLDLGTGKMPGKDVVVTKEKLRWEIDGVRTWMYDVVEPASQYTVADYVGDALKIVAEIGARGSLPVVVGGTGLYLRALVEGLPNLAIPTDPSLRGELESLSLKQLQDKLQALSLANPDLIGVSPTVGVRWENLNESDRQNKRRLLRSIELIMMYPYSKKVPVISLKSQNYDLLKVGLTAPRQVLYEKIDSRLASRILDGMVEEAERLHKDGFSLERMRQLGLEYGALADYLAGKLNQQQLVDSLKTKIHHFAKRQMTWFKKEPEVNWFDITSQGWRGKVDKLIDRWYHGEHGAQG